MKRCFVHHNPSVTYRGLRQGRGHRIRRTTATKCVFQKASGQRWMWCLRFVQKWKFLSKECVKGQCFSYGGKKNNNLSSTLKGFFFSWFNFRWAFSITLFSMVPLLRPLLQKTTNAFPYPSDFLLIPHFTSRLSCLCHLLPFLKEPKGKLRLSVYVAALRSFRFKPLLLNTCFGRHKHRWKSLRVSLYATKTSQIYPQVSLKISSAVAWLLAALLAVITPSSPPLDVKVSQ